jgi:hypothetical protein
MRPFTGSGEKRRERFVRARFIAPWSMQHPLVLGRDKSRPYIPILSAYQGIAAMLTKPNLRQGFLNIGG